MGCTMSAYKNTQSVEFNTNKLIDNKIPNRIQNKNHVKTSEM